MDGWRQQEKAPPAEGMTGVNVQGNKGCITFSETGDLNFSAEASKRKAVVGLFLESVRPAALMPQQVVVALKALKGLPYLV